MSFYMQQCLSTLSMCVWWCHGRCTPAHSHVVTTLLSWLSGILKCWLGDLTRFDALLYVLHTWTNLLLLWYLAVLWNSLLLAESCLQCQCPIFVWCLCWRRLYSRGAVLPWCTAVLRWFQLRRNYYWDHVSWLQFGDPLRSKCHSSWLTVMQQRFLNSIMLRQHSGLVRSTIS